MNSTCMTLILLILAPLYLQNVLYITFRTFFQLADQAFEGHHLSNSLNQSFHFSGYEKHYAFLGANILTLTL